MERVLPSSHTCWNIRMTDGVRTGQMKWSTSHLEKHTYFAARTDGDGPRSFLPVSNRSPITFGCEAAQGKNKQYQSAGRLILASESTSTNVSGDFRPRLRLLDNGLTMDTGK